MGLEIGTNNIQEKLEESIFKTIFVKMKKFLLSIHGDFKTKNVCKEIATTLTPIVDSPHLKFTHKHNNLLFCFESDVDQIELHDYIQGSLYGLFDYFILSVIGDNLSVCMDKTTSGHLFDLENDSEDVEMRIDMKEEIYNPKNNFEDEELDRTFLLELMKDLRTQIRTPSLDEILDKIKEKGMKSITPYEKEILDNFGK